MWETRSAWSGGTLTGHARTLTLYSEPGGWTEASIRMCCQLLPPALLEEYRGADVAMGLGVGDGVRRVHAASRAGRICARMEGWEEGVSPGLGPQHPAAWSCPQLGLRQLWWSSFPGEDQELGLDMFHWKTL